MKAVAWSEKILVDNLKDRMFKEDKDEKNRKVDTIKKELCDHAISLSHARHLSFQKCKEIGLIVEELETDQKFQDLVLSLHHITMQTLATTSAYKIIENHNGQAFIQQVAMLQK
jgi:hypothetical protein